MKVSKGGRYRFFVVTKVTKSQFLFFIFLISYVQNNLNAYIGKMRHVQASNQSGHETFQSRNIYIYIYTYIKVILLIPISTLVSLVTLFNIFIS